MYKKLLGIDWGEKRIGLAIGNTETNLASPYKTVNKIEDILGVVLEEGVDEIIIGNPIKMSGEMPSESFTEFIESLKSDLAIPVVLLDERLTSKLSDKLEGNKKTKANRDEVSAMLILQNYIDKENARNI